jgi:hypothetical protein
LLHALYIWSTIPQWLCFAPTKRRSLHELPSRLTVTRYQQLRRLSRVMRQMSSAVYTASMRQQSMPLDPIKLRKLRVLCILWTHRKPERLARIKLR